jgi:hypothetical protein
VLADHLLLDRKPHPASPTLPFHFDFVLPVPCVRSELGLHAGLVEMGRVLISDTSFQPFTPANGRSIELAGVLGGCRQHPCDAGESCSYLNYSLSCSPCSQYTASENGLECRPCGPGTGPRVDRKGCEPCVAGQVSAYGVCETCPPGTSPQADERGLFIDCIDLGQAQLTDAAQVAQVLNDSNVLPQSTLEVEVGAEVLVSNSAAQLAFIEGLTTELATALGVLPELLQISNLRPATAADGRRLQSSGQGTTAAFDLLVNSPDPGIRIGVITDFANQMADAGSALRTGTLTGRIDPTVAPTFEFVCPRGMVRSAGGLECQECARGHGRPNKDQSECLACPLNQQPGPNGCQCDANHYNASHPSARNGAGAGWSEVRCIDKGKDFRLVPRSADPTLGEFSEECQKCPEGDCVACGADGTIKVMPGFAVSAGRAEAARSLDSMRGGTRCVFECTGSSDDVGVAQQCQGDQNTNETWCAAGYDGALCSNCAEGYARRGYHRGREVRCISAFPRRCTLYRYSFHCSVCAVHRVPESRIDH